MEEKILFKGIFTKYNWYAMFFAAVGALLLFIDLIILRDNIGFLATAFEQGLIEAYIIVGALICFVISIIFYVFMRNCQIVITDKIIYGQAALGKKVSLPLDKISAISTNALNCLTVSTSSGKLSFWLITNGDEAWQLVNSLIVDRQR